MRILYIHQYFRTPDEPGGTRSYWFSLELIEKGYEVLMLTSRNKQNKLIEREIIQGIEVIYIRNSYDNNYGVFKRIWSFLKFMILSTFVALKEKNVALVFATSTPLTTGFPALIVNWIKRTDFVFEVRDLWPRVPIEMKVIKNKLVIKALYFFEKRIYKKAKHIIALSPSMRQGIIDRNIDPNKISVIPNMSDCVTFYPKEKSYSLHEMFKIGKDNLIAIHTGAMGEVNGLCKFVENVAIFSNNIHFVFIGKGKEKKKLSEFSQKYSNIHVIDSVLKKELNLIINDADICLMLVDPLFRIFETNSANKFFEYLSVGKPVAMNYKGWKYEYISNNSCGFAFDQSLKGDFDNKVVEYKKQFKEMGINSRQIAETIFDKSILTKKFVNIINNYLR